ncbi:MAG TPA: alpha-L-arabinofuranosidase [Clostridiaceae bacterium]|nr:alpha-L-arabinofuranosidase [Clostridiaceae bacterium]
MLKKGKILLSVILTLVMALGIASTTPVQAADVTGSFIYGNTTDNRCFYERAVVLPNGDILCTFMRSFPPANWSTNAKSFYFYKSSDGGKTWSFVSELNSSTNGGFPVEKQGMPGLFVLPQQLGQFPAGTILFATTDWSTGPYCIHIWRSTNNGATWQYHSSLAARGTNDGITKGNNVWEPEFAVSSDGRLVCYYSDERQIGYDQCIVREISDDGGLTWGNFAIIVGKNDAPTGVSGWRPGMPRVLRLKNGNYFMAFENINCDPSYPQGVISFKISTDGINWGNATSMGTVVKTSDNQYAVQCPEIALVDDGSTYGRLFVRGMNDTCITNKCLTSTDNGATWTTIDAPLTVFRRESVGSSWSGTFLAKGNTLIEINNFFNGSFNEVRCGTGIVDSHGIIISGAQYKLTNQNSGLCLDDLGGSTTAGTQIGQWHDNGLDTQRWKADYMGNGYYKLTCMFSNLLLDNYNGLSTPGNKIIQWHDNGMDPQRWTITHTGNGYYKLVNKASGLVLDVSGGSTAPAAYVVQNIDNGSASQRWKVEQDNIVRLESKNITNTFVRHSNYRVQISHRDDFRTTPFQDSEWKIVPGLADSSCVSFESVNRPGYFLRHRDGQVWIDPKSDTALFKADATWRIKPGLADSSMYSFEAYNFPGQYMRHRDGLMWMTTISTDLDKNDATFKILK